MFDATNRVALQRATYTDLSTRLRTFTTIAPASRWGLNGQDPDTRDWVIEFWPVPDGTQTLLVDIFNPQDDLVDDTDVLKVPGALVVLGAYSLALAERGDDANMVQAATNAAERALSRAIAAEVNSRFEDEVTWVPQ